MVEQAFIWESTERYSPPYKNLEILPTTFPSLKAIPGSTLAGHKMNLKVFFKFNKKKEVQKLSVSTKNKKKLKTT